MNIDSEPKLLQDCEKNQLLTDQACHEKTDVPLSQSKTTYNTNAAPSEFEGTSEAEGPAEVQAEVQAEAQAPLEGYDFRGLLWAEIDALDLRVTHRGKEIKLMTYRWPAANERKGVIFMLHGYGACAPHSAVMGKFLAAGGYEVFALDMMGMGDSEGERGICFGTDQVYGDSWAFVFEACKKFKIDQQRTPMFLFGRSYGGLLATNMASTVLGQSMFSGVVLITPYYRLFTEKLNEAYKYLVPLTMVRPNHIFNNEYSTEMDPDYYAKYAEIFEDPRNVNFFTAVTARLWVEEQERSKSAVALAPQPFCFIIAEEDGVVRNDYIEDFAKLNPNAQSELHYVKDANHTDLVFNEHYGSQVIRKSLAFLDKIVQ